MITAKGIPTMYDGWRFRSRLEAKWAKFFDLCGWTYEYEPLDLNGYIPDFIIKWNRPLLVEVKPAVEYSELQEYAGKIERSGWCHDALIVGSMLGPAYEHGTLCLGLLSQRDYRDGLPIGADWGWGPGVIIRCRHCDDPGLYNADMGWYDYRCGAGGKVYGPILEAEQWWRHAANTVQWKGQVQP